MTIADVLAVLAGLALLAGGVQALVLLGNLVFPDVTDRAGRHIETSPATTTAIGFAVLAGSLVAAGIVANALVFGGRAVGLAVLLGGLCLAVLGAGGLARRLTRSISPHADVSFKRLATVTALVELAVVTPVVGWFVILPAVFALSLGAGFRAVVQRRKGVAGSPTPTVPAMSFTRQPMTLE